ncbi:MAG: hypothetical protein HYY13_06245 [Nitrospirae bacterium]|nr:hypothetical protein [Nitrospirota bacterium]
MAILIWLGGCGEEDKKESVSVNNDETELAERLSRTDVDVPIEEAALPAAPGRRAEKDDEGVEAEKAEKKPEGIKLTLVAEVASPFVGGQTLQATSVRLTGNYALVSYNVQGEKFSGAVDVIDIQDPAKPTLVSQALFSDTDVSSVTTKGEQVFAAGATSDPGSSTQAVLQALSIKKGKLGLEGLTRLSLSSFAGTAVAASGDRVYATSGDKGALFSFDRSMLELVKQLDLSDARWVAVAGDEVAVLQGTVGQLSMVDKKSLSLSRELDFKGADVSQSKNTVAIKGGKAFVAAGPSGVQVLELKTGKLLATIPVPAVKDLDPSVVVTNAASVYGNLVFISNGEAGVYLAQSPKSISKMKSEEAPEFPAQGKLRFSALQSVNHVEYKKKTLIVAAGLGGVKIVKVDNTSIEEEDEEEEEDD